MIVEGNARMGFGINDAGYREYFFVRSEEDEAFHEQTTNYNCTGGAGACNISDPDSIRAMVLRRRFVSQDELVFMYMGFAFIKKFIPPDATFAGDNIVGMISLMATNVFDDLEKDNYIIGGGGLVETLVELDGNFLTDFSLGCGFNPNNTTGLDPNLSTIRQYLCSLGGSTSGSNAQFETADLLLFLGWETLGIIYTLDEAQQFITNGPKRGYYGFDFDFNFPPIFLSIPGTTLVGTVEISRAWWSKFLFYSDASGLGTPGITH